MVSSISVTDILVLVLFSLITVGTNTIVVAAASSRGLPDTVFWNNAWPSDLTLPSSTTTQDDKKYELLEGTVLFAQSQIIPSKHGIVGDNQPHLTAQRKTLVMMRPFNIDDDDGEIMMMTVRDRNGNVIEDDIRMADPSQIPKQAGWTELAEDVNIEDIKNMPDALSGDRYVVQNQANLDTIGNDPTAVGLKQVMNSNTQNHQIEIKTWDGSWVKDIYLPDGGSVPSNTKLQITCNSGYNVNLYLPNDDGSSFRGHTVSNGQTLVAMVVGDGQTWITKNDVIHNDYVFGHNFYTTILDRNWVVPGMTLEFTTSTTGDGGEDGDDRLRWSLEEPYYKIEGQADIVSVGDDEDSIGFQNVFDDDHQLMVSTYDGSWLGDFYLPSPDLITIGTKVQFKCDSSWGYNVHYTTNGEEDDVTTTTRVESGEELFLIVLEGGEEDRIKGWYTKDTYVRSIPQKIGVLDDIDIGGVTELMITLLDVGLLTEPRNEFTFKDNPSLHREYFETTLASRLIVVEYESLYLEEIMLPTGTFYPSGSISDTEGGWHEGDMRKYIGKLLLSHGIDFANYGIASSTGGTEEGHPFTCALLAAHNTVGMYQNGRVVHGGSGGNGMVTLTESIGNEFSHEVGHNYGLVHFFDGFEGSVHRSAEEINSSWGWDSQSNIFTPNFAGSNSGKETCLEGYGTTCQAPFLGKYQYGIDSMSGGSPMWPGLNQFTMYTPNVSKIIQTFLEGKAVWDPSSSTGFSKFDPATRTTKEYTNSANNGKVPRLYRVPVTTVVGYYDPDPSRGLESYVYPALHGAYGFVYNDDGITGLSTTGTPEGCELVIGTTNNGVLVFNLSTTSDDAKYMNKFHVNIATEDQPYEAKIFCNNALRAQRALDGPISNTNEASPLSYTVTGVPFDNDDDDNNVTIQEVTPDAPVQNNNDDCKDSSERFLWNKKKNKTKNCKWLRKRLTKNGGEKKVTKFCKRKDKIDKKIRLWDWCPSTCRTVGLGPCVSNLS